MLDPLYIECETENCLHWSPEGCRCSGTLLVRDHQCTEFKNIHNSTVTIEVQGGSVQSVYRSPDLQDFQVNLIDFDALEAEETEGPESVEQARRRLEDLQKIHIQIL